MNWRNLLLFFFYLLLFSIFNVISIGIGDLIIDLDADIEKSSKIESSLISPLDPVTNNNKKSAAACKNSIKEGIESEKGVLKKNLKGS